MIMDKYDNKTLFKNQKTILFIKIGHFYMTLIGDGGELWENILEINTKYK
jgi:hypothetical protein